MGILFYLQRIGRSLMVPVAVLPAAAILFGIRYGIDPNWGAGNIFAAFLIKSELAIIDNIPYQNGDEVAVLINGLGSTPLEEQYVVFRRVK